MVDDTHTATTNRAPPGYGRPTEVHQGIHTEVPLQRKTEPMAVVAVVLGVVGFIVPFLPSLLALLFGYPARRRVAADPSLRGDGMALTGIILGWVAIVFYLLVVLILQFGSM